MKTDITTVRLRHTRPGWIHQLDLFFPRMGFSASLRSHCRHSWVWCLPRRVAGLISWSWTCQGCRKPCNCTKKRYACWTRLTGNTRSMPFIAWWEANAEGDNLWLEGTLFPLLRQQTRVRPTTVSLPEWLCASLSSGIKDTVGGFADHRSCHGRRIQPWRLPVLAHQDIGWTSGRSRSWKIHETLQRYGIRQDENWPWNGCSTRLSGRPAVGILPCRHIGQLSARQAYWRRNASGYIWRRTGMMQPHASVCGLMFAHPASRYFSVGKIDETTHGLCFPPKIDADVLRKYLAANLQP